MVDGKLCKRCNQFVLYSDFYKWKLGKDGYADWCKACRSSHDKSVYPETKVRRCRISFNQTTVVRSVARI